MDEFSKHFKTRLSDALKNNTANFAGHYIVTFWACGFDCTLGAIIDVITGQAYPLPKITSVNPRKPGFDKGQEIIYHLDSHLIVFAGNIWTKKDHYEPDTIMFVDFNDGQFTLLKSMPYCREQPSLKDDEEKDIFSNPMCDSKKSNN